MGKLSRFDLKDFAQNFKCRHFIETGTGVGEGVRFAASYSFETLTSCEIEAELADRARKVCASDPRIQIVTGTSSEMLKGRLVSLPQDQAILFWLDAHYPGADYVHANYGQRDNIDLRLPLERELELIKQHRPEGRDVFLIDDLRIYEEGPFAHGNNPAFAQILPPDRRNIDFAFRLFGESHQIARSYADEGYLVMIPRSLP